MPAADAYLKALAAAAAIIITLTLVPAARRLGAAQRLGVFLVLIGANQGAEAVRAVVPDAGAQMAAFRVASIAAALDPLALWVFVGSVLPLRIARHRGALVAVATPAFALALVAGWGLPAPVETGFTRAFAIVLAGYTALAYGALAVATFASLRGEASSHAARFLAPALAVVSVSYPSRFVDMTGLAMVAGSWHALLDVAASLAFATLLYRLSRGVLPAVRGVHLGVLLTLVGRSADLLPALGVAVGEQLVPLGRGEAALRWIAFGAFTSTAILRDELLAMSLSARRLAARVILFAAFVSVALFALVVVGSVLARPLLRGPEVVLLLAAVALSQAFRRGVDAVALRVYGVPARGDAAGAHDAYRRAVASALAAGRFPARDAQLQHLREELGLDAATASHIESLADDARFEDLHVGRVVAGRYRLEREREASAEAREFVAHDLLIGRDVDLVVVRVHDPARLRDARLASGILDANVVTLLDVLERDGHAILVSEHVEGPTLGARSAPADPAERRRVLAQVVSGVAAAHARGVAHGALGLASVRFLAGTSALKVAGFGRARLASGHAPTTEEDVRALGRLGVHLALEGDVAVRRALDGGFPDAGAMLAALKA